MKEEEKKNLKIIQRAVIVLTFLQILFWYNWLESITYAVAYINWFAYLVFITFTISAVVFIIGYWRMTKKRGKTVLIIFFCLLSLNSLFGCWAYFIANYENSIFDTTDENAVRNMLEEKLSNTDPAETLDLLNVPQKIKKSNDPFEKQQRFTILYQNNENDLFIIGKKRSIIKRYCALEEFMNYNDTSFVDVILPQDFHDYTYLVDPFLRQYMGENYHPLIQFLSWQYPDYIFLLIKIGDKEDFDDILSFSIREKFAIGQVQPLLEELLTGKISNRLKTYHQLLVFTFQSPFYRTDLVNDPYFLIERGDLAAARQKVQTLPQKRKDFIEKKLQASELFLKK